MTTKARDSYGRFIGGGIYENQKPIHRIFNGKKFLLQGHHERKSQAQVDATIKRRQNLLVRVVKDSPTGYLIYVRGK
jgi:hypothetical protein